MSISLLNGDCLNLLETVPDDSIDAIICDLPYATTDCAWDLAIDFNRLWTHYTRVAKEHAPIVLFSSQPFTSKLIMSANKHYRFVWYWEKEKGTNFLATKKQPLRVIEEICVFCRSANWTYNPQMVPLAKPYTHTLPLKRSAIHGTGMVSGQHGAQTAEKRHYRTYTHAHPKNVVRFSRDQANKSLVPTQKPLALMEYLVETFSNPNDLVLDNTMGSGTTGVACKRLGRSFIGMEMSEKHFEIAQKRIDEAQPVDRDDDLFVFPS